MTQLELAMVQPIPIGQDVMEVPRWSHLLHKNLEGRPGRVGDAKLVIDRCSLLHWHGARIIPAFGCRVAARERLARRGVDAQIELGLQDISANTKHIVR
jgi:hypothetical protein